MEGRTFEVALAAVRRSGPIEDQITAVEALGRATRLAAAEVVSALVQADHEPSRQYLLYERLGYFGTTALEPLRAALPNCRGETRILVAAAMLVLGDATAVMEVASAVKPGAPLLGVATSAVVHARWGGAADAILSALRACPVEDFTALTTLVSGLEGLGVALPADVRDQLRAVEPAWMRLSLLGPDGG